MGFSFSHLCQGICMKNRINNYEINLNRNETDKKTTQNDKENNNEIITIKLEEKGENECRNLLKEYEINRINNTRVYYQPEEQTCEPFVSVFVCFCVCIDRPETYMYVCIYTYIQYRYT